MTSFLRARGGRCSARGRFMDAPTDKEVTYLKTINYPAESKQCALLKCQRAAFLKSD